MTDLENLFPPFRRTGFDYSTSGAPSIEFASIFGGGSAMETPIVDNKPILETLFSRWRAPCMSVGVELGFFEELNAAPASAAELARRLDLNERAMRAVLPVLAGSGLLYARGGRYGLTTAARTYLLKDSHFFFGAKLMTQARSMSEFEELLKALRHKDEYKGERKRPVEGWEAGQISPEMAKNLAAYMQAECVGLAAGAAKSGVYKGVKKMLDVGGGSGVMSIAIASHQPGTTCTVMDLPTMCAEAGEYIKAAGVGDKVDTKVVDMFRQPWPEGYDGMVFSNIYHDWRFDTCATISALAFKALMPGGKIFLHEMLLNDDLSGPVATAGFSTQMLLGTQGQQFSFLELKALLEEAGFKDIGVTHTFGYYSVVTGVKP